jgi:NAD(P)H-nitrite reductase large subunit
LEKTRENIPEKGAAVQKDMENYAIIPYIPGGLLDPVTLRKLADVAEKYQVKHLKVTSEHRIGFYGIREDQIGPILEELEMEPGGFTGKCVRGVKFCIGNTSCKKAYQNTLELGLKIDENFHKTPTPDKVKISLSGCPNSCAESKVRDIGIIGTPKGWRYLVGGTCGLQVKEGKVLAKNLSDEEVLDLTTDILDYYKKIDFKKRLGYLIENEGFETFKEEVLKK